MPKVVVMHQVVEVERWLGGKAERAAVVARYATDVTDHVAMDGGNSTAVARRASSGLPPRGVSPAHL